MRQRVDIAIALACNPTVLIADEPTSALDVTIQAQILQMMRQLKEENDTSMILITHDLGVVAEMCDDVAVMYAGHIVEYGTLEEVFNHTKTSVYRRFVCIIAEYTQACGKAASDPGPDAGSVQSAEELRFCGTVPIRDRRMPGKSTGNCYVFRDAQSCVQRIQKS